MEIPRRIDHEHKIIPGWKESAGLSIKGHCAAKDGGVDATLFAAEAFASCGARLNVQLNVGVPKSWQSRVDADRVKVIFADDVWVLTRWS